MSNHIIVDKFLEQKGQNLQENPSCKLCVGYSLSLTVPRAGSTEASGKMKHKKGQVAHLNRADRENEEIEMALERARGQRGRAY